MNEVWNRLSLLSHLAAISFGCFALAAPVLSQGTITVSVLPQSAAVVLGQTQQFEADFSDPGDSVGQWQVNGVVGGNSSVGTVSPGGLYEAPGAVPTGTVTVTAVSSMNAADSASAPVIVVGPGTSKTFYVSAAGLDTNHGTLTNPWRTIQHAVKSVHAGDTIYVRAGTYNERVMISLAGSQSAGFTTISSYPGETAIVDGTGITPPGQGGLIDIHDTNFLAVQGLVVQNFKTSKSSQVPIGIYIWGHDNSLQILNNHIQDIVTTVKTSAGDALGLAVYGTEPKTPISNLVISGNELDNLITGYSESMTINGNVQYFQVLGNLVHDNDNIGIDAIGFEPTDSNKLTDQARDGLIAQNTVYNISSLHNPAYNGQLGADGLYVDGGTRIVLERNLVHDADIGIEMASEHHGHVASYCTARDNVVYNSLLVGMSIGGYAKTVGGTDHCVAVNNTLFNDDTHKTGTGEFQIQFNATNNVIENNIMYANSQGLYLNSFAKYSTAPAVVDYNLYFGPTGAGDGQWVWNQATRTGFSNYVAKTGNDKHSQFVDPQFVNLANLDFDIMSSSPAVDAGLLLGSLYVGQFDFAGSPRVQPGGIDAGAYEH